MAHQLLNDHLDDLPEAELVILHIYEVHELGNHFCVCVGLEGVASLREESFDFFVVGDDTVVHHHKLVLYVGTLRM